MHALLICSTLLFAQQDKPRPVAFILQVTGTVAVERGKEKIPKLSQADLLLPGDRIQPAAGAEVVLVFLKDSHRERLKAGTQAAVARTGCDPAGEPVETAAKLSPRNLKRVSEVLDGRGGIGVVRGDKSPTEPRVKPLHGALVASDHPTLTWPAVAKAEGYRVEMFDAGGKLLWKEETKEARLPYPEKQLVLQRVTGEEKYLWSVTAHLPGDEEQRIVDRSNFKLLLKGELEALAPVRKLAASTETPDLLLAALGFESYSVYDEALLLFEELAKREPDVANYQLALARYYTHAGRDDLAKQALEKAKKIEEASKK